MGQEALKIIAQAGLDASDFYYGKRGIYGYFEKHSQFKRFGLAKLEPNSYVLKTIREDKWTGRKQNFRVYDVKDKLAELYHAIEESKSTGEEIFYLLRL